jgi:hypothetical protein
MLTSSSAEFAAVALRDRIEIGNTAADDAITGSSVVVRLDFLKHLE